MALKDIPIQKKLMRGFLLTTGAVLSLTCTSYFAYEFFTYRHTTVRQLSTLATVIASNSTAALAFLNREDAKDVLSAVRADTHIVAVALYDEQGDLFTYYPESLAPGDFPSYRHETGYFFRQSHLLGYEPVVQADKRLGTLFIKSDMGAIYDRLILYSLIALMVIALSFLLAYLLSRRLQREISTPILQLAETARAVSDRQDYSVRAKKVTEDEIGLLTEAFNQMLGRIEEQTTEITSFNQGLEQRVVERTRELEAANQELEAFSYSVSHDLRAPLRSIHGYMNIFSEEYSHQLDREGKRLINIILTNGAKMGMLIDDLLAFSQLGRKDLRKASISMKGLVEEVWREQTALDKGRRVKLLLHQLPPATADGSTMKQVWANLVSNALKYTRNREQARVEIGSINEGNAVIYYIRDNGAGFEMKYYNKLFGVFQRLHSETEFPGTGVGLAIVERIILRHGGSIWAESTVNEGTTFFFTLTKRDPVPPVR